MAHSKVQLKGSTGLGRNGLQTTRISSPQKLGLKEAFGLALEAHKAGRLGQAESLYRQILKSVPEHPGSLNYLGLIRHRQGATADAIALMRRSVALAPNNPPMLNNLGTVLLDDGDLDGAAEMFEEATNLDPNYVAAWYNWGNLLRRLERAGEAEFAYRRVIALKPDHAAALNNLGVVLQDQGRPDEAEAAYRQALAIHPHYVEALSNLSNALKEQGHNEEALTAAETAIAQDQNHAAAHNNRSVALTALARYQEAEDAARRALALAPEDPSVHANLGVALLEQDQLDQAESHFQSALAIKPDFIQAINNLGNVFKARSNLGDAEQCYRTALALNDNYAEAHHNLGNCLREEGRLAEAEAAYARALEIDPEHAEARGSLAMLQLLTGRFAEGWEGYEVRHRMKMMAGKITRPPTIPRWDGSPLDGASILLQAEQGLGDTLQFARYASLVEARGGRVVLCVQKPLKPLLQGLASRCHVITSEEEVPEVACYAPLMSLPKIFATRLETVPDTVPYLAPDPTLVETWRTKLDAAVEPREDAIRIGIAWQGNPRFPRDASRSIPLSAFEPLGELANVRLISLQKGHGSEQLVEQAASMPIATLGPNVDDTAGAFMDSAAVMQHLDLVIASDSAVCHLAGALGRPVWTLLAHVPDWRWLLLREDSPWYPTMRIFRQQRAGDWAGVMTEVAAAVATLASNR